MNCINLVRILISDVDNKFRDATFPEYKVVYVSRTAQVPSSYRKIIIKGVQINHDLKEIQLIG